MASQTDVLICTEELCERVSLTAAELEEIVAHGIIQPDAVIVGDWQFAVQVTTRAARAARLHRDLHIDWAGVALVLQLLGEVHSLRGESGRLRARLARFEDTRDFRAGH